MDREEMRNAAREAGLIFNEDHGNELSRKLHEDRVLAFGKLLIDREMERTVGPVMKNDQLAIALNWWRDGEMLQARTIINSASRVITIRGAVAESAEALFEEMVARSEDGAPS
jgi:hypothetical protein